MWELFSGGGVPYPSLSNEEAFAAVLKGIRLSKPDNCPDDMWALVELCWTSDSSDRPSFLALLQQILKLVAYEEEEANDIPIAKREKEEPILYN